MEKSNKKLGLTTKIFIALILGAICGVVLYYWVQMELLGMMY